MPEDNRSQRSRLLEERGSSNLFIRGSIDLLEPEDVEAGRLAHRVADLARLEAEDGAENLGRQPSGVPLDAAEVPALVGRDGVVRVRFEGSRRRRQEEEVRVRNLSKVSPPLRHR